MDRLPELLPLSDFRDNLAAHLRRIRKVRGPVLVTQNGRAAAVVLSPREYELLMERLELAESRDKIRRSMEDVRAGRSLPVDEAFDKVRKSLGLSARGRTAEISRRRRAAG